MILGLAFGPAVLGTGEPWVNFLAGIGAIVLTFLAGVELDPQVFKLKWKERRKERYGKSENGRLR